jgi:cytochrome c oxidase subunit III
MEAAIEIRNKIPSKLFALWVGCAGIGMMFAAFTSAYIVRQGAGNWLEFELPNQFYLSAFTIVASSLVLHFAYWSYKNKWTKAYRIGLVVVFLLGLLFLVLQYSGWLALYDIGVALNTNPSGSFVYVISGVHAAHLLAGLAIILVALIHSLALPHKVTNQRLLRFKLTFTYWHFMGGLWLYLLCFFTLYR